MKWIDIAFIIFVLIVAVVIANIIQYETNELEKCNAKTDCSKYTCLAEMGTRGTNEKILHQVEYQNCLLEERKDDFKR